MKITGITGDHMPDYFAYASLCSQSARLGEESLNGIVSKFNFQDRVLARLDGSPRPPGENILDGRSSELQSDCFRRRCRAAAGVWRRRHGEAPREGPDLVIPGSVTIPVALTSWRTGQKLVLTFPEAPVRV